MSSSPAPSDSHRDQMILRAERRREMLEQLSDMGMKAAERLAHRTWAPEVGDEAARHGLAFAKVSRAVRLTLLLEAKIDEQILALRNGLTPTAVAWLEPGIGAGQGAPNRDDGAKAVVLMERDAIEHRAGDGEAFADREFDRLPAGGFRACVAAICDDLGVAPDWSCWSDEEGLVGDDASLPFMGRVETKRSEVRGGGVGDHVDVAGLGLTSPPRSRLGASRPSP